MDEKKIVEFQEIKTDNCKIDTAIKQGNQIISVLKKMGITEATFDTGMYVKNDMENNTSVISSEGITMHKNKHTTNITILNEGSTKEEALKEIKDNGDTQKVLGAFAGTTQQNISKTLIEDKDNKSLEEEQVTPTSK